MMEVTSYPTCLKDACRYFDLKTGNNSGRVLRLAEGMPEYLQMELLLEIANNVTSEELKTNPQALQEFVDAYFEIAKVEMLL